MVISLIRLIQVIMENQIFKIFLNIHNITKKWIKILESIIKVKILSNHKNLTHQIIIFKTKILTIKSNRL